MKELNDREFAKLLAKAGSVSNRRSGFSVDSQEGRAVLSTSGHALSVDFAKPGGREEALFLAGPGRAAFQHARLMDAKSVDRKFKHFPKGCYLATGADGLIVAAYAPGRAGENKAWNDLIAFESNHPRLFSKAAWLCKADYVAEVAVARPHAFADALSDPKAMGIEQTGMSFRSRRSRHGSLPEDLVNGFPAVWDVPGEWVGRFYDDRECIVEDVGFADLAGAPLINHKGYSGLNNPRDLLPNDHELVRKNRQALIRTAALAWKEARSAQSGQADAKLSRMAGRDLSGADLDKARARAARLAGKAMVGDSRVVLVNSLQTDCAQGQGRTTWVSLDMAVVDGQHSSRDYSTCLRLISGESAEILGVAATELSMFRSIFQEHAFGAQSKVDATAWDDFRKFFAESMMTSIRIKPILSEDWAVEQAHMANARRAMGSEQLDLAASKALAEFGSAAAEGAAMAGSGMRLGINKSLAGDANFGSHPEWVASIHEVWEPLSAMVGKSAGRSFIAPMDVSAGCKAALMAFPDLAGPHLEQAGVKFALTQAFMVSAKRRLFALGGASLKKTEKGLQAMMDGSASPAREHALRQSLEEGLGEGSGAEKSRLSAFGLMVSSMAVARRLADCAKLLAGKAFKGAEGESYQDMMLACGVLLRDAKKEGGIGSTEFLTLASQSAGRMDALWKESAPGSKATLREAYECLVEMAGGEMSAKEQQDRAPELLSRLCVEKPEMARLVFDAIPGELGWAALPMPSARLKAKVAKRV